MKSKSLLIQLAVAITFFISIFEFAIFIGSYRSQKESLKQLRVEVISELKAHSLSNINLNLKTLNDEDIESRMDNYTRNIFFIVLAIIIFVVSGTVIIFHYIAGRHINRLDKVNRITDDNRIEFFPEDKIPNNKLGDVIRNRNLMVDQIQDYQNDLEGKLQELKGQFIHTAKLSAIGEFTSTIAHDLKNPLTSIIGNNSILEHLNKSELGENEKVSKIIAKVAFASERLNKMVDRMNKFNRSEFIIKDHVDIEDVFSNSIVLIESKIKMNSVNMDINFDQENKFVSVDSSSIEQVFMNLISNAIDAMENTNERTISISSSKSDNFLLISLKDNGPGIPAESSESIFNSFFTTKEEGKGTGLGLNIVKNIVESHNGTIQLNTNFMSGAEFLISLPLSS